MQNSTFLVLLRPIFAPKMKTAPSKGIWKPKVWKTCCHLDQNSGVFGPGAHPKSLKTFFFFWSLPNFGRKIPLNFWNLARKSLWIPFFVFFWRSPNFHWKITTIQLKFGWSSFTAVSNFKKSPPPSPLRNRGYAPVGNTMFDLTDPRFEPRTSRSIDECVTARPTGQYMFFFCYCLN